MKHTSIYQQTLLIALLPMLIAVGLLDAYFMYFRFNSIESNLFDKAALLAKQIGSTGEYALFSGNTEQLDQEANAALKQRGVVVVVIQDTADKIVSYAGEAISDVEREEIRKQGSLERIIDTSEYLWVKEPIATSSVDLGGLPEAGREIQGNKMGAVLVKMSKQSLIEEKRNVILSSLLILIFIFVIAMIVAFRVSRNIIKPIRQLNLLARSIGEGDLSRRLPFFPEIIELYELAFSIDEMAKQLQRDKDELERQTEALRANEERLNEIVSTMPVSLFIKDAQSRIIFMNSACEAQWGMLFSNLVGTDGSQYFPPEQMTSFLEKDREAFAVRKMVNFEELVWNAEFKLNRMLHSFKKPVFNLDGTPRYLICLSIDITDRKKAESDLKQLNEQLEDRIEAATLALRHKKEEAEIANRDKSRFLASASHDLRQPMHALGLFVGQLQSIKSSAEQKKLTAKIEESVDALSNLLDALLDISKLDAGVVTPQLKDFCIGEMLERIATNYMPIADNKGIALRVVPNNAMLYSDPVLLERIIVNFVSNAIRYTPSGGRVMLICRQRGEKLRIEVRDNGMGIPPNEQKNIFREFVQLQNEERDRGKGLGLGLAIVDRISKLLDYEIGIKSELGKGAVFAVYVPKSPAAESGLPVQELSRVEKEMAPVFNEFDGLNVLVIDDDALVRGSMQGIVESWGCQVKLATSLTGVKEIYPRYRFDLVICDYRLPSGSGIEVINWINACSNVRPLYILISGDTSPDVLKRVNEFGIQLLHKPVRPAKLRSLIQYMLDKKAAEKIQGNTELSPEL